MTLNAKTTDITSNLLGQMLLKKAWRISVAESCTGGLVSKIITDVAGSSQWFDRGFITYTNEAKVSMLGLSEETLSTFGAVSIETVEAMAQGVLSHSLADVSLAISGVAGPSGGSVKKPVGTVCFAWANKQGEIFSEVKLLSGDREAVRNQAARYSLEVMMDKFL